jgi:hypothetical protein
MAKEMDPEVAADIALRNATMRDRSRSREMPTYVPARITGKVPCRGRCGAVVDWTEDAEDQFKIFNGILKAKMEAPLDKTMIVFCAECKREGQAAAAEMNRKKADAMAKLIAELKTKTDPPGEKELLAKLEKLGHPDVTGLLLALRDKAIANKQPRKASKGSF